MISTYGVLIIIGVPAPTLLTGLILPAGVTDGAGGLDSAAAEGDADGFGFGAA